MSTPVLEAISAELKRVRQALTVEPDEAKKRTLLEDADRLVRAKGSLLNEWPGEAAIRADERRAVSRIIRANERQNVLNVVNRCFGRVAMVRVLDRLRSNDRHEPEPKEATS